MNWARITTAPVTTERRVRVLNAAGDEGWVGVEWVSRSVRLVGPVVGDDGEVLDDDPQFTSSVRHLVLPPFAATLASLRAERNLTLQDLADASGLTKQAISNYESGARRPTWDAVQQLAAALGVPTDTFRDR